MGWNDDWGGVVVKATEAKLFVPGHTWGMKLSQLAKQAGRVRILTYSLPDREYIARQLGRRPNNIALICHTRFRDRAVTLKYDFPGIDVALSDTMHAKLLLIEPATVYVGSANFGESDWTEVCIGVRSRPGHDWYADMFDRLWQKSEVLP